MTKEQDPDPDPLVRGMGSADPDPNPHQNVMDPQHWLDPVVMYSTVGLRRYHENHPS
jgi:hypothetical protein